jgi:cytochrome P450 / NADPH-cytochrome P450 reductase
MVPVISNYRIFFKDNNEPEKTSEELLDFKTKASLNAETSDVVSIKDLRQNKHDGSTLELKIELKGHPEYQTAGNIALYSKNDPKIVQEIIEYFGLKEADLDRKITLVEIHPDKKIKLNFVPNTLRTLLEESIDIQGKLTKSVLKKLSKCESSNPQYFTDNSSAKTTEEYKRLTDAADLGYWYNIIKIVKEYQVKLAFEDFVELSDSMAPRLFTIASHYNTERDVVVAASLVENGLISKFFLTKPETMRAELRKSTFADAMKWKKVIFVAAGTGLAPFRAFLQQKVYNLKQKS